MNRSETLYYLLYLDTHHIKRQVKLMDGDFKVKLEEIKAPNELVALTDTKPLTNEGYKSL